MSTNFLVLVFYWAPRSFRVLAIWSKSNDYSRLGGTALYGFFIKKKKSMILRSLMNFFFIRRRNFIILRSWKCKIYSIITKLAEWVVNGKNCVDWTLVTLRIKKKKNTGNFIWWVILFRMGNTISKVNAIRHWLHKCLGYTRMEKSLWQKNCSFGPYECSLSSKWVFHFFKKWSFKKKR